MCEGRETPRSRSTTARRGRSRSYHGSLAGASGPRRLSKPRTTGANTPTNRRSAGVERGRRAQRQPGEARLTPLRSDATHAGDERLRARLHGPTTPSPWGEREQRTPAIVTPAHRRARAFGRPRNTRLGTEGVARCGANTARAARGRFVFL